ncbi:oxidative damage protective factor for iron-sulfur proteins [Gammaproteobacteria bacterium]|nr:oxidative damage protective factor for iron-sulfur proteins [Gammaproteobacteria bacterium]
MRLVHCRKLNKELEALVKPTYPGELGLRIFNEISSDAWQMWLKHQTILINEYRLNPLDSKSRSFLKEQMLEFFFGTEVSVPEQFSPLV